MFRDVVRGNVPFIGLCTCQAKCRTMISITDAATVCGLTQGEISSLIHSKIILPEEYSSYGTGTRALLSDRNLKELGIIRRLRLAGVRRAYIKGILDLLRDSRQSWWDDSSWIVLGGGSAFYVTTNPFEEMNIAKMRSSEITIIVKL